MKPVFLSPGDVVDVLAPGFACDRETLEGSAEWLLEKGFEPRIPRGLFGRDALSANGDARRAQHLIEALRAPDSTGVWCLRGGYGSIRLLPFLRAVRRPKRQKLLIGLSDISTLLIHLDQAWGWPSVHGPLLDRFAAGRVKPLWEREMLRLVSGQLGRLEHAGLRPMNRAAADPRTAPVRAIVTGGNLITLQSSFGTPWAWRTAGRILFFEELGERGYRIDRALTQMRQSGAFRRARAVIFGDFLGGDEPGGGTRVQAVLKRFADESEFPVFRGLRTGHGEVQRPLVVGLSGTLDLGARGRLVQIVGAAPGPP